MPRKSPIKLPHRPHQTFTDLQGGGRLVIAGVQGITNIVEAMHRNIAGRAPIKGASLPGPTRGISGFVYRRVRGVTSLVGKGLDAAFSQLAKRVPGGEASAGREAARAAANGLFGDYLAETGNSLTIQMALRYAGKPILIQRDALRLMLSAAGDKPAAGTKLLIMVHGLCMNDLQWQRAGHDHGKVLGAAKGATVLYLHYNTGRHIAENGREFADLLESLIQQWPVPLKEITIIGHSMGGLVTRSACEVAKAAKQTWLRHLKAMVFLGTPHLGAPLERAGRGLDLLLDVSPYTAPFARIGLTRSAGIQDLRHGRFTEPSAKDGQPSLPGGVACFVIAASSQKPPPSAGIGRRGDGLVPIASALALPLPTSHQAIFYELNHFDLLSSSAVCDKISAWL
ncbi:MAG: alpha/beta hydrolase [Rhodocyclaceae bacterium]|nr:alpha/beta hydrolase [Rhodocyclaceae bacterium]MCA3059504.1 alpha/beta hydrolase [Rhodocyclaceae bacterium]MCA3083814.1 alpha/beta hydrolase [Rhodocyclaceae bacterium]